MYHDVVPEGAEDTSGFAGPDAAIYKVTPELFDAHLVAIRRVSSPPDPRDLPDLRAGGMPLFTFDDGGASATQAAERLEAHGYRGHFFVTTDYIGSRGFAGEHDLRDLRRRGHVIGS